MMKFRRILPYLFAAYFAIAAYGSAHAQVYNRFGPVTGVLKGDVNTYQTTAAASSDVIGLWTGTCNASTFMRADGSCQVPAGTGVTSVALTVPSGLSVTGSPVTSTGTLGITTTLNGLIHGNGSGFTAGIANVADGGTGVATLTGIAKGSGTSAFTAAVSTDVRALWTGTCDNTTFLRGDGTCAAGAGGSGANPTATIGLTAVNGVAASFIRSDGAPALSQAIVPTWTALHTFTLPRGVLLSSTAPDLGFVETGAAANNRRWEFQVTGEKFIGQAVNDAINAAQSWVEVDRTANVIDSISFPQGQVVAGAPLTPVGTANALVMNGQPRLYLNETAAAANNRMWRAFANSSVFSFTAADDTISTESPFLSVSRSGTTIGTLGLFGTTINANGNPIAVFTSSTFSGTITGCTTAPTYNFRYDKVGILATVTITNSPLGCTSNSTAHAFAAGTLPAAITPSSARCAVAIGSDNSVATIPMSWTFNTNGSINVSPGGCSVSAGTTSGTFAGGTQGAALTYAVF